MGGYLSGSQKSLDCQPVMNQTHKVKFIINPNADHGKAWRIAADLRPIITENGGADWAGSVYPTHTVELTRQAVEEGYSLILAGGGDGTVHEVINGVMAFPPEQRPRIGVIPLGSGNDFAHALGMADEPWQALKQIYRGTAKPVDVGRIKDDLGREEYWINTVGIGFDAVVTIYSHQLPLVRGFLMYFAAVMKTIFLNHDPMEITLRWGEEGSWKHPLSMLTLCNGPREGGGFMISPGSKIDDACLDYVAVHQVPRWLMLRLIPEFMRGSHLRFTPIQHGTFQHLELESNRPLNIHLDGEIFAGFSSKLRSLEVDLFPGAVQFVS